MNKNNNNVKIMSLEGSWFKQDNGEFSFDTKADRKYIDKKMVRK